MPVPNWQKQQPNDMPLPLQTIRYATTQIDKTVPVHTAHDDISRQDAKSPVVPNDGTSQFLPTQFKRQILTERDMPERHAVTFLNIPNDTPSNFYTGHMTPPAFHTRDMTTPRYVTVQVASHLSTNQDSSGTRPTKPNDYSIRFRDWPARNKTTARDGTQHLHYQQATLHVNSLRHKRQT